MWTYACDRVRVQGVTIINNRLGPNTDGIDPDCSSNVHISDCYIDAGDDCIALKSHAKQLGATRGCENVTVTNCVLITCCNAIRIGYEGDAPIRNCTFSNLVISNTRTGINMVVPRTGKGKIEHGPSIENILFQNIVMDTRAAMFLWIGDTAASPGCIRNVRFADMLATTERGCHIGGSRTIPMEGLSFSNVKLTVRGDDMDDGFAEEVPYPYGVWGHWATRGIPHAFYCRNARDLEFHNVRVDWKNTGGSWLSAVRCENVDTLDINGLTARQAPDSAAAAVHLTNVQNASVRGCRAEHGTGRFLAVDGDLTRDISTTT